MCVKMAIQHHTAMYIVVLLSVYAGQLRRGQVRPGQPLYNLVQLSGLRRQAPMVECGVSFPTKFWCIPFGPHRIHHYSIKADSNHN
ncbi:Uncharacterized protein TCM_016029 [Theobroma cacao]|uniref:Secreted protein n=1 Tax=Theobroma cacao TaxID=3641 RepID=A0A061GBJ2_THECC|nr:Uncharacterized protein TCM_016029 [Theobroma cacao]